jgi:hypothetical protein
MVRSITAAAGCAAGRASLTRQVKQLPPGARGGPRLHRIQHVLIRYMLNLESVISYEGTETIHPLTVGRELTGLNAF